MAINDLEDLVGRFESRGNYDVGYGGADLSDAPLNPLGFPIWGGREGPAGISHAAGKYQFEPAEWARYAGPLGITDFSPQSQDRVFAAAVANEGLRPWIPYNQNLANALKGATLGATSGSGVPTIPLANISNLPSELSQPVVAPPTASPFELPVGPGSLTGSNQVQTMLMLSLIGNLLKGNVKATPVDYDPWKIAGQKSPFEGL